MKTTFIAQPNPAYPGKGQRQFCIMRTDEDGISYMLPRQFNKLSTATAEAYRIRVNFERALRRSVYLGD